MSSSREENNRKNAVHIEFLEMIARSGDQARDWVAEFREPRHWDKLDQIFGALRKFKMNRISEGDNMLSMVEQEHGRNSTDPAMFHLTNRWLFSARAYQKYLLDDFNGGLVEMRKARLEVYRALQFYEFLVPFAAQIVDYTIQLARLARREGNWAEVARRITILRDIYLGRVPAFVLSEDRSIFYADIERFIWRYSTDQEMINRKRELLDNPRGYLENVRWLAEHIYTSPDMLISYP